MQHYNWVGLNRQNKKKGRYRILTNKSITKSCTIETKFNKTIEFMNVKLNLTNNESMMICLYYDKQDFRSTRKESANEFNEISTYINVLIVIHTFPYLVILMPK